MARGKSRGQRGDFSTPLATEGLLSEIEDNRRFTFERPRAALTVSGNVAPVGERGSFRVPVHRTLELMENPASVVPVRKVTNAVRRNYYKSLSPAGRRALARTQMVFDAPSRVVHCVRRKVRKEVLFAFRKTRKGSGRGRRHRNEWSNVSC